MVVIENFEVGNMSRSAAGTVEQPGRNVQQKTGLNKSILDQGVGRVSPANEIQDDLDWRPVGPGSTKKHQHYLSCMWTYLQGEPQEASAVYFCRVRLL